MVFELCYSVKVSTWVEQAELVGGDYFGCIVCPIPFHVIRYVQGEDGCHDGPAYHDKGEDHLQNHKIHSLLHKVFGCS